MYLYFLFLLYVHLYGNNIISSFKLRKIQTDNDITTDEYIFSLDNKNHHMILTELESNNLEASVWVDGKTYQSSINEKGQIMKGKFANDPNSKIFLHVKNGINGIISIGNNTFEIKPMKNIQTMKQMNENLKSLLNNDHDHIAVLSKIDKNTRQHCGNTIDQSIYSKNIKMKYYDTHFSVNPSVRNITKTLIVSVAVPLEAYLDKRMGNGDINTTIDSVLKHFHTMNYFYTPFNMAVLVGHIEIFTDYRYISQLNKKKFGDFLTDAQNMRKRFFVNGRRDFAVTVLFTTYTDSSTVGLSINGYICNKGGSYVSVTAILIRDLVQTAYTIAHEIGHCFGLPHTEDRGDPNCNCAKTCIMSYYAHSGGLNDFAWSPCDYKTFIDSWYKFCVDVRPNFKPLDKAYCGNNILESDEDCDCGLPSDCAAKKLDKCCDPVACKFNPGCNCNGGPCCKDCKILPNNSVCYNNSNECLSGVCSGLKIECELTNMLPNGTLCNNKMDNCYNGKCIEHGSKCVDIFGNLGSLGNETCHSYFNERTNPSGNCGYDASVQKFIKCEKEDILCGKLICNTGIVSHNETSYSYEVNPDGCTVKYIKKLNKNFKNIFMVNDGITCGTNKTCFNNKCLSSEEIFEYKALKICGKFASITVNDECMCTSKYEKINSMCFLRSISKKYAYAIIILFAISQILIVLISSAFIILLFRSKCIKITSIATWNASLEEEKQTATM